MIKVASIFAQVISLINRREFSRSVSELEAEKGAKGFRCWEQLVCMLFCHLASADSLREICGGLASSMGRMVHLGIKRMPKRSTLSYANSHRSWQLFEKVFYQLLSEADLLAAKQKRRFRFKNPLFSMDASTIELSLSIFPWAEFRKKKGAIKLHVGLDHSGLMPAFMSVTEGKCHDIQAARGIDLPTGSIIAVDRGYNDYEWFNDLNNKGIFFVTRLKKNARFKVVARRTVNKKDGLTSDQEIKLTSQKGGLYEGQLRRVGYICPETGKHYFFLTNNMKLSAKTIAAIYKERWQIELFFKWIKQNLKIKSFVGTSKNAVLTQIWIAMCAYLLMAYLKFASRITMAVSEMVRLLQLNLFERRSLHDLLNPPDRFDPGECRQLLML